MAGGRWLLVLLASLCGCSEDQRVEGLIAQLAQPQRREQAIEGLLVVVRETPGSRRETIQKRAVFALMEAYRQDLHRPQIVAALALLRSRRAEQVFAAALQDAARDGEYFEAAIRSARLLGELGLRSRVPELIKALEQAQAAPRGDHNIWLERTLITALGQLGDRRATEVLVKVLQTEPARQDFYLNKLAARALGKLGAHAAAPQLVASLGATAHGLLLREESRRALCRLGPGASRALLDTATGTDGRAAVEAMRVLGDLGLQEVVPRLKTITPAAHDAHSALALARAETLLRLGFGEVAEDLLKLAGSREASLSARRRAVELLGWYGGPSVAPLMTAACGEGAQVGGGEQKKSETQQGGTPRGGVLCWTLALALTRSGGARELKLLDRVAARADEVTRHYLRRYRPRLAMVASCDSGGAAAVDTACRRSRLTVADWRVRERAVLDLWRAGKPGWPALVAKGFAREHLQVQQAILVSLERVATLPRGLAGKLAMRPASGTATRAESGEDAADSATRSRMICLKERLRRQAHSASRPVER